MRDFIHSSMKVVETHMSYNTPGVVLFCQEKAKAIFENKHQIDLCEFRFAEDDIFFFVDRDPTTSIHWTPGLS